jgi:hypothetical protein
VPFVTQKQQAGIINKLSINISKCCLFITESLDPFFMRKTMSRFKADVAKRCNVAQHISNAAT